MSAGCKSGTELFKYPCLCVIDGFCGHREHGCDLRSFKSVEPTHKNVTFELGKQFSHFPAKLLSLFLADEEIDDINATGYFVGVIAFDTLAHTLVRLEQVAQSTSNDNGCIKSERYLLLVNIKAHSRAVKPEQCLAIIFV